MLKLGICDVSELGSRRASGPLGRRRFVAVTLYPEVCAGALPDRDRLLERILARFPTRNATLKRTASRRFERFDRAVASAVRAHFGTGAEIRVHDVAVSDGRTAADFFRLLAEIEGLRPRFLASDYAPDVLAISDAESRLVVVVDPASHDLLQVVRPPFVLNVRQGESPLLYPLNRLVLQWLLATAVPRLLDRWRAGDLSVEERRIWLLHPDCERLRREDPRFEFVRHDLLDPPPGRFQVVRAMNVLNPSYFSEPDMDRVVHRLVGSVADGGLFVTGSNEHAGSTVHGAIYVRRGTMLEPLHVSGHGSPVAERIRAAAQAAPSADPGPPVSEVC